MPRIKYFATTHYTGLLSKMYRANQKRHYMAHSSSINAHIILHKYRQVSFFSRHYSLHPSSFNLFSSCSLFLSLSLSLSGLLVAHPTLKSMTPSVLVQLCFPHLPAQTGYQQLLYGSMMSRRVTRWGTSTTEAAGGTNTQRMCECVCTA